MLAHKRGRRRLWPPNLLELYSASSAAQSCLRSCRGGSRLSARSTRTNYCVLQAAPTVFSTRVLLLFHRPVGEREPEQLLDTDGKPKTQVDYDKVLTDKIIKRIKVVRYSFS